MILKKDNQANYSEITQKLDHLGRILKRDRLKFLFYGYPEDKLDQFEKKISLLKRFPADDHYKRKLVNRTAKKEELKQLLIIELNSVCIELLLASKSNQLSDPSTMTDKQLLHASCSIIESLNQIIINDNSTICTLESKALFESLIVRFEEAIFEQTEVTLMRIHKSIERSKQINDLFDDCAEISKQGQYIWNSINSKNHDDYKSFEIKMPAVEITASE